jgi:hypothetical protein
MPEPVQTTEEVTEPITPEIEPKPDQPSQPTEVELLKKENEELKKKFGASTTENQLLREADEARKKAVQELTNQPTDSDLRTAFPLWDSYDDVQKDFAKRTFAAERTAGNAVRIAQSLQQTNSWATSIELAIASNTALQGKEQAFRQFASQPKYQGTDMSLLVDAFLHKNPATPSTPVTPKPGLEPGSGGPRQNPKPETLSSEQLTALRTSDPKAYEQYLKTHEINVEV